MNESTGMVPTLDSLAMSVAQWQRKTFPAGTIRGAMRHMIQELDEAMFALSDGGPGEKFGGELADIFFMLVQAADKAGVNLAEAVDRKLEINRRRQWKAPDARGVVLHVEGT